MHSLPQLTAARALPNPGVIPPPPKYGGLGYRPPPQFGVGGYGNFVLERDLQLPDLGVIGSSCNTLAFNLCEEARLIDFFNCEARCRRECGPFVPDPRLSCTACKAGICRSL